MCGQAAAGAAGVFPALAVLLGAHFVHEHYWGALHGVYVNLQAELSLLTAHLRVHVHLCMQMLPCAPRAGSHKDPLLLLHTLSFCYGGDANVLPV